MIQNLLRSCLVCSITLITFGVAVEVLKSSEFEDKDIPFLLNWKGEKQEKNHEIDGSWWRWVQEENEKTITEETPRNSRDKNSNTLVFKRSVRPFRPNIYPLKSLLNSEARHDRPNKKRWISSSFGFGNKKKSRKDYKQPLVDVRKTGLSRVTPSPKVMQDAGDENPNVRTNSIPHDSFNIRSDTNVLNSTYRLRGSVNDFGQSLDIGDFPPTRKRIRPESQKFDEKFSDGRVNKKFHSEHRLSKYEGELNNLKTSTTHHPAYATAGKMFGDLQSTRRLSVDPKIWAKYTTETIFDRVLETFTELRFNPQRMKFPFPELSLTSKQYTERPSMYATFNGGPVNSRYVSPIRSREQSRSEFPRNHFLEVKKINGMGGGAHQFVVSDNNERAVRPNRHFDVFDQISIPSISSSDTFEQFHKMEKISRNNYHSSDVNKIRYKDGDLISNVVPSLKTQKNFRGKQIVVGANEGPNYDMLPDEKEPFENPLASFPAKLQTKVNRNHTENITFARNSATDVARSHCGTGGGCGKCGGGVNISIMMPSPPVLATTVDNSAAQISHSTSASDKNKKKKERKKKPNKNSEDSTSNSVVSGMKDKSNVKSKSVSANRWNNDSIMFKNKSFPTSEQQRSPLVFGNMDERSKNEFHKFIAASGGLFESKHNVSHDAPHGNMSSWNYLNMMHQMHHPIPPTVFGPLPTVCGSAEDEDDDDELKELYDEQNNMKTEYNTGPSTMLYPSRGKPTQSYATRNFLYGKNALHNAVEKIGVLDKLKNNNSGSKLPGLGKDIKYPSLTKKNKDSNPKKENHFEDCDEQWVKYSFPMERNSDIGIDNRNYEVNSVVRSRMNHQIMSRSHSYTSQRHQEYLVPNEDPQESEYYDQWDALDADLKNDLTGGGQEDLRVRVKNRKREVEEEDSIGDAKVGYYRLSSGSSLKNPTNMIVSAFRRAKMNHEKKPFIYEEMAPDGEGISVNPTTVAHTSN